jgi:hypothetical protein
MATLWAKGSQDFDKLNEIEQYQFRKMLIWWFIFYENVFFQNKSELLVQAIAFAWMKDIEPFVERQRVEMYWPSLRKKYHPEFAKYIDSLISAKTGSSPP